MLELGMFMQRHQLGVTQLCSESPQKQGEKSWKSQRSLVGSRQEQNCSVVRQQQQQQHISTVSAAVDQGTSELMLLETKTRQNSEAQL